MSQYPLPPALRELEEARDDVVVALIRRRLLVAGYRGVDRLNLAEMYRDNGRDIDAVLEIVRSFNSVLRASTRPGIVELAWWIYARSRMVKRFQSRGWLLPE